MSPTLDNYVPSGFYLGIGAFDAPPSLPIVNFGTTLVYAVPQDVEFVNFTWATTPQISDHRAL